MDPPLSPAHRADGLHDFAYFVPLIPGVSKELTFGRIAPVCIVAGSAKRHCVIYCVRPVFFLGDDMMNLSAQVLANAASEMSLLFYLCLEFFWKRHVFQK
jgi:hypothetical protein